MTTEALTHLSQYDPAALAATVHELSVEQVIARINKVHDVMKRAMVVDHHYGVIPGTPKPTLLKPGAELLCVMFRLDPQYQAVADRTEGLSYTTTCTLWHIPTGQRMGSGMGSCSTRESKYAYRKESRKCPKCGSDAIIKGRAEYGGGWLCFGKKGGCGAKYADKDPAILEQPTGRVANEDVADQENTVLKMSNKRALVAAVLNVTAASDIFTQDLEDQPREEVAAPRPVQVEEPGLTADTERKDSVEQHAAPRQTEIIDLSGDTPEEIKQRLMLIKEITDRKTFLKLSNEDWLSYKKKRLGLASFQSCTLKDLEDLKGDLFYAR